MKRAAQFVTLFIIVPCLLISAFMAGQLSMRPEIDKANAMAARSIADAQDEVPTITSLATHLKACTDQLGADTAVMNASADTMRKAHQELIACGYR